MMTLARLRSLGFTCTLNPDIQGFTLSGDTSKLNTRCKELIALSKPAILAELSATSQPLPYQRLVEMIRFARHEVELEHTVDLITHHPTLTPAQMEDLAGIVMYESRRINQGLVNAPVGTGWTDGGE